MGDKNKSFSLFREEFNNIWNISPIALNSFISATARAETHRFYFSLWIPKDCFKCPVSLHTHPHSLCYRNSERKHSLASVTMSLASLSPSSPSTQRASFFKRQDSVAALKNLVQITKLPVRHIKALESQEKKEF